MTYSKVLVPIAPSYGKDARRALDVARSLLDPGGMITVVSVLEDMPRYLYPEVASIIPVVEENQRAVREAMARDFTAPDVEVVTLSGHPTRAILDLAKEEDHDCIVIASAQPGWEHFFLGSTASGVVRHARCSVHVVRG
ncbi:universal stress protein [Ornithinimicrobium avium]|uniref:universal stress protein n=1 Tax=Ornithinimicrobium avium TaxID=2283195 RepID=UPI0013B46E91|nr:universal stress protein [Ornithinimicrobium avium]